MATTTLNSVGPMPPVPQTQPEPERQPGGPCTRCGQAPGLTLSRYYEGRICADCRELGRLEAAYEQELEQRSGCFD